MDLNACCKGYKPAQERLVVFSLDAKKTKNIQENVQEVQVDFKSTIKSIKIGWRFQGTFNGTLVEIKSIGTMQAEAKIRGLTNNPRFSGLNLITLGGNYVHHLRTLHPYCWGERSQAWVF